MDGSMAGVTPEQAAAILDSVPEDWPLVAAGEAQVADGRHVVLLEVEEATPEIRAWLAQQPPGAVHLTAVVRGAAGGTA
ncbi:hypothetical protein SAMN05660642_04646 [Geodermatophilus siccatus]|uniref:Uncharacterized protein n=2 Tax=Geodermatophilus siccatus TaxID=1137991 RepID=A0A1H0APF3_9ACTN|nr:hypothetical protein SAMN05660642_04646 [Geodermatophilus siccatus]